ncbi:hypothetical protein, partial [Methylobacterium sp.]|uniref:hypothetical protein n=1 Tax=Methylobacterium sp. TaxID=409 RepID=UPI003B017D77
KACDASGVQRAYERRREVAAGESARLRARERTLSPARLASFAAILVVGWLAFGSGTISGAWVWLPIALFAGFSSCTTA